MINILRDKVNLDYTLRQFEAVLKVNPNVTNLNEQVILSRRAIEENIYESIPDGKTIYDLEGHEKTDMFLGSITECLKNFSLVVTLEAYDLNFGQTLKSLNYLGSSELSITNSFKILSKRELQSERVHFFSDLLKGFSAAGIGELRRIVCIMGIFENIGMMDAVAILAHHVVLGSHK